MFKKRIFRYYYWLIVEFIKKHARLILISFLISFIGAIFFLSVFPYLKTVFVKGEIIGIVGDYDLNNPPEEIVSKITNGLITVSNKGEIIPLISTSWEVINDGKTYRFHLKDNLLWSDGKKFTANEINYQFKDVKIVAIDEKTIDFQLVNPLAIFPNYLNKPILKYPLIGVAGLYKVDRWKMEFGNLTEVVLIPNTKNILPLKYRFYKDESQMINAYKRGEINQMTLTKKSIVDTFKNWKNSQVTKEIDYSRLLTIFLNSKNKLLSNKNIKAALTMMIDYTKLSEFGEIARGPIPPISWAFNPNLKTNSYDIETAGKIIKKEIESTASAQLNLVTYYDYYDVADSISTEMEKAGLKVDLNIISSDRPDSFDMLLAFWKVPTDPDQYYFWHSTQTEGNIGNYKNVKIDLLLEEGRKTINIEERQKIYFDFQKIIQDDPPAIFLYYPYVYTIKRK